MYDQTLFGNHANQTDLNSSPTLRTAAEGNKNCYFMKFNSNQTMISYINLSAVSGQDDIVNKVNASLSFDLRQIQLHILLILLMVFWS